MLALLPQGPFALAAFALIVVGLAVIARKGIPKAYGLGFLMLLVFALDVAAGIAKKPGATEELGFVAARFFSGQAWWTPVTALFVHADLSHIVGNLFILVTAGPALEERVGARKFLLIFFAAGLAGFAAHAIFAYATTLTDPGALALGASGAIFGVLTAFAVRYPREKLPVIFYFILWLPSFVVLLIYLAFNVALMFTHTTVAWWGHFAGFLVGLAFAYTLPKHEDLGQLPRGNKGLPDVEKLEPYATSPDLKRILENVRQFSPDARTAHDSTFAQAWLDKFFSKARCAQGHAFRREGMRATCAGGETVVDFARGN